MEPTLSEQPKTETPTPMSPPPIQAPKPEPPKEKPASQWIASALSNPKLSKPSRQVLENLKADKAFTISAKKYGEAISESIMLQNSAVQSKTINFEDELKKRIEFKAGSYAIIYKGLMPARISPFLWQLDQGTRRSWMVFSFNNFYGNKDPHPLQVWKRFWKILVLTPFDAAANMVEYYGKGYLAKVDEISQFQMPTNTQDTERAEKMRVDNKHFISSALTLWMDLLPFTKPKINMKLVIYLIVAAGIVVFIFWFMKSHPGFLSVLHLG